MNCIHCESVVEKRFFCSKCLKILPILDYNYFTLLEISPNFDVNLESLELSFFTKLKKIHPDKFINFTSLEKDIATNNAAILNAAYETLINPLLKARYILELHGYIVDGTVKISSSVMSELFILREELEDVSSIHELNHIESLIKEILKNLWNDISFKFKQKLYKEAVQIYVDINFIEHFKKDIKQKKYILDI